MLAGIVYSDVFHMANFIDPLLDTMAGHYDTDICKIRNVQLGACGLKIKSNPEKSIFAAINGNQDPEELIENYSKYGKNAFSFLGGDFSLMLFDQKKGSLFLARDRIGKKNLYWYHDGHQFIFASQLKALLATGIIPQSIENVGIASYLYLGYIPQDLSPIKNVNKLLPAHYLEFNVSGTKFIRSYWSFSSCFSKEPVLDSLDHLLKKSVDKSLVNARNGTIGCAISGGVGSASIAHYLRDENVEAFTAVFNEEDLKAAETVAQSLNMPHEQKIVPPNLDSLVNIVWHLDEPIADPNILASWELFKLASQKTSSIFSGMGSDELLASHTRYSLHDQPPLLWQKYKTVLIPFLKLFWKSSLLSLLKKSRTNPSQYHYLCDNALFSDKQLASAAPKLKGLFDAETFLNKFPSLYQFKSNRAAYTYFDVKTRLADCYLFQYENLSRAHHLTLYTPFLDPSVVEYLASVFDQESNPLKEILRNVYPESFLNRPKVTRPGLLHNWLFEPKIHEVFCLLKQGLLVENGIISKKWLQDALSGHASFQCLFAVLVLEIWYRLFINQAITPLPPDIPLKELLLLRH